MTELVRAGRSPESLAKAFEPTAQTIRNWVTQDDRDTGKRSDGLTSAERDELVRLSTISDGASPRFLVLNLMVRSTTAAVPDNRYASIRLSSPAQNGNRISALPENGKSLAGNQGERIAA